MEYLVLGSLEVRAGDGPLPLGCAKQRALLALLLLNRVATACTSFTSAPATRVR